MTEGLRTFYLERDFYSTPEVVLIVAESEEAATALMNQQLDEENYEHGRFGPLKELGTETQSITILRPPGDRHLR